MNLDLANPVGAVGARGSHAVGPRVSAPRTTDQTSLAGEWPSSLPARAGLPGPAQAKLA